MRTLTLLCSIAILTANVLAASTLPAPGATAAVATAPATAVPVACQAGALAGVVQAAATATALPIAAEPSSSILRSPGGTPRPFWALGGNCWGQFSSCRIGCGGNSLCQEGCECAYCVCAGLLCPDYCGSGQN